MSTFLEKLEPCKETVQCDYTQEKKQTVQMAFSVGPVFGFSKYFRALFINLVKNYRKYVKRITRKYDNK